MVGPNRIPSGIAAALLMPSQVDALWYALSHLDTAGDGAERLFSDAMDHEVPKKIVHVFDYSAVRIVNTPAVRVSVSAYDRVFQR